LSSIIKRKEKEQGKEKPPKEQYSHKRFLPYPDTPVRKREGKGKKTSSPKLSGATSFSLRIFLTNTGTDGAAARCLDLQHLNT
jgi:hypothetical protein